MKRYTIVLLGMAIGVGAFPQAHARPGQNWFQKGINTVLEFFGWSVEKLEPRDYKNPHHNSLTHRGWCLEDVLPEKIKGALRDGSFDGRIAPVVLYADKAPFIPQEVVIQMNNSVNPKEEFEKCVAYCTSRAEQEGGIRHTFNGMSQFILGDGSVPNITITKVPDTIKVKTVPEPKGPEMADLYDMVIIDVHHSHYPLGQQLPVGVEGRLILQSAPNEPTLRVEKNLVLSVENPERMIVSGIGKSGFFGPRLSPQLEEKLIQIPLGWPAYLPTKKSIQKSSMSESTTKGNCCTTPLIARVLGILDGCSVCLGGQGVFKNSAGSQKIISDSCTIFHPYVVRTDTEGTLFGIADQHGQRYDQKFYTFSRKKVLELMQEKFGAVLQCHDWKTHPLFKTSGSKEWCAVDEGGYFQGSFFFFQAEAHKCPEAKEWILHWVKTIYRISFGALGFLKWDISSEVKKGAHGVPDTVEVMPPTEFLADSQKTTISKNRMIYAALRGVIGDEYKGIVPACVVNNKDLGDVLFYNESILTEQAFVDLNNLYLEKASEEDMKLFLHGSEEFLFYYFMSAIELKAKKISCCGFEFKNKEMQLSETVAAMMAQRRLDLDVLLEKALVPPPVNNEKREGGVDPLVTALKRESLLSHEEDWVDIQKIQKSSKKWKNE